MEFHTSSHVFEIEQKIKSSLKEEPNGGCVFFLEFDMGKILCKYSKVLRNKSKETQNISIPHEDVVNFKNICRLMLGANYIAFCSFKNISSLYKMAYLFKIYPVVEFCTRVFKKYIHIADNIALICDLVLNYNDMDLREVIEDFRKHHRMYEKFICNAFNFDSEGEISETDDLGSQHIHYAHGDYIQCNNLINTNQQYSSYNVNYKDIDANCKFSSVFNVCENEEITLSLDSDFGKFFCENSNVIKNMLEYTCSESQTYSIPQNHFEAFKNIYRLFMGANYIKAATIFDVISVYEMGDFYDIPLVMEIGRNLFKKHICIRNVDCLQHLSERCHGDKELKKIVLSFKAGYQRYSSEIRYNYPKWLQPSRGSNFVELVEILDFSFNIYNCYQ